MGGMPRYTLLDGTTVGFVEAGTGEATPIVFLHGVGSDKSVWRPQLAHFGTGRRAIAFDYPGYGDSDPAPAGLVAADHYSQACWHPPHACHLGSGALRALASRA